MADNPPPYESTSHRYVRDESKQKSPPPILAWPDPYVYSNVAFITTAISKDGAPVRSSGSLVGLNESFITDKTGLGPQTTMLVTPVAPEYLRLVQGFQDCGVVEVPRSGMANIDDVRNLLSTQLFESGNEDHQWTDLKVHMTQPRDKVFAQDSKDDAQMLELRVYRIDLYSKYAQGLVASESFVNVILLFRWSKVHAIYGQLGSAWWKPDLNDILKEAEFRAGDGLELSVLGVSEKQWDRYRLDGSSEME